MHVILNLALKQVSACIDGGMVWKLFCIKGQPRHSLDPETNHIFVTAVTGTNSTAILIFFFSDNPKHIHGGTFSNKHYEIYKVMPCLLLLEVSPELDISIFKCLITLRYKMSQMFVEDCCFAPFKCTHYDKLQHMSTMITHQ